MKNYFRASALLLGGALALSALAACTPQEEQNTPTGDAASDVRICYDNLGGGTSMRPSPRQALRAPRWSRALMRRACA